MGHRLHRLAAGLVATLTGLGLAQVPAGATAPAELAPVMLVLDASGSMAGDAPGGGDKMAAARRAVRDVVGGLPEGARVGLIVYGTGTGNSAAEKAAGCRDVQVLHEVGADASALVDAVDGIRPRGYTPIGQALRTAAAALPAEGPRSIVLVSDGEDTCAPPDPCDVARDLSEQGVEMRVHTVGFDVDAAAKKQLTCVAQATKGSYTDAADARDIGPALDRVTGVALRNYEPTGTPVTGGADQRSAPVLVPGAYLDQIDAGQAKYYSVEVPAGHTARLSATAIVPTDTPSGEFLTLNRYAAEGSRCGTQNLNVRDSGEPVVPLVRVWTTDPGADRPCDRPGTFSLRVERRAGTGEDRGPAPLEIGVILEPPATDPGPASAAARVTFQEPAGDPTRVTGGGSFATAGTLDGSGGYTDTLHAGEFVFYRVRLGWGQGLAYRVSFPDVQRISPSVTVKAAHYAPDRTEIGKTSLTIYDGKAVKLPRDEDAMATMPVRYLNRERRDGGAEAVAGWYYIAVRYGGRAFLLENRTYPPVGIRIDVSVAGTPEPGPVYAEAGAPGQATPSAAASPAAPESRGPAEPTPERTEGGFWATLADAGPVFWLGGPLLLLLVALTTILLVRRRTRDQERPPYGPGGPR